MKPTYIVPALFAAACATTPATQDTPPPPNVSYHQHLASPAIGELMGYPGLSFEGETLIGQLDDAGIRRAVVLSVAYMFGDDRRQVEQEEEKVRAENDWTSAAVSRWPDRLVGFCGVNPLREYAVSELERCARLPGMIGIKLHFGNSGVSLRNPDHLAAVGRVFEMANVEGLPLVVHMRAREGTEFGRQDAQIFLDRLLPLAPNSVVQVAHMTGAGGYPDYADAAMSVFAAATRARDPRTHLLFFDLTSVVTAETSIDEGRNIAARLREVGMNRALFGADMALGDNPPPRESWELFLAKTPLTAAEFSDIADNVAPYLR